MCNKKVIAYEFYARDLYINLSNAGVDFRRQNLTSINVSKTITKVFIII